MENDFETLLESLAVDVCPDMLIAHASTESMLHTLPTVELYPDMSLMVQLRIARMCGESTVVAPIVRALSTRTL